jgi:hypothetical protein
VYRLPQLDGMMNLISYYLACDIGDGGIALVGAESRSFGLEKEAVHGVFIGIRWVGNRVIGGALYCFCLVLD